MKQSKIEKAFIYLVTMNKPVSAAAISSHLSNCFGVVQVGSTAIGSMMADLRKKGCDVLCVNKGINPKTKAQINLYELLFGIMATITIKLRGWLSRPKGV
jgi:hypothetical protein